MNFKTPIALIIYNRPEKTERVFSVIKKIKPSNLYIIADGPKNEADKAYCDKARAVINTIDWKTDIKMNLSDSNLGNANRTISGLNWVFEQTDKAIILEDDCVPHHSFFEFCETLLDYYNYDEQIMHISGSNLLPAHSHTFQSNYFFSKYILPPWGWATWRRAWNKFNPDMNSWQKHKTEIHPNICQENFKTWTDTFEYLRIHKVTWDIPWNIDIWANKGLGIIPSVNLISNIGFDEQATFTKTHTKFSELPYGEMKFPLIHPQNKNTIFDKEIEAACIKLLENISP